ncbi:MAG: YtxH domain-containing protein [Armatimonadetes bacterium]|nr:YtxH domain-containing protein [Armatimonadota bacterium]
MFKSFWAGLLLGGAIGAALGMFLAPAPGRESRSKVTEAAQSASGKITKFGKRVHWKAHDALKAIKQAI